MDDNPILIIDDDHDDMDLIKEVVSHLNIERSIHYFKSGRELESFLQTSAKAPFLIICDVNLPEEDGFAIKKRISGIKELKYKAVPFIYWSTDRSEEHTSELQSRRDLVCRLLLEKKKKKNEKKK